MDNWTLLQWAYYYYHVRVWHIAPKRKGTKWTYLPYKEDGHKFERYTWAFLEAEFSRTDIEIDGICLIAGKASNVTIYDYDPKHDQSKIGQDICRLFPPTLKSETGGAITGNHYFGAYMPPNGDRLKLFGCIDKRNDGLIVLPPSIHPDTGLSYSWLTDKDYQLADLSVKEIIEEENAKRDSTGDVKDNLNFKNGELKDIKEYRNNTLYYICLNLAGTFPKQKELAYSIVKAFYEKYIDKAGFTERELKTTFESAYKSDVFKESLKEFGKEKRRSWKNPYTPEEMLAYQRPKENWGIEHFMPLNTTTVLTANPKVGKTWLCLEMAIAVATGRKFLNTYNTVQGNVLYVDLELGISEMKRRLELLGFTKDMPIHFIYDKSFLVNQHMAEDFASLMTERNIKYFFIDTLRRAHTGRENDSDVISNLYRTLDFWVDCGATGFITHHNRKPPPGTFIQESRGSTDVIGGCGHHINMMKPDPNKPNEYKITFPDVRCEAVEKPMSLWFEEKDGACSFKFMGNLSFEDDIKSVFKNKKDLFKTELTSLLKGTDGIERADLLKLFIEKFKFSIDTFDRRIQELLDAEYIDKIGDEDDKRGVVYILND